MAGSNRPCHPKMKKIKCNYGALAPRIPFWTFATAICGISEPESKIQLTNAQSAIWKSYDRRVALTMEESDAYTELTDLKPWMVGEKATPFMQLVLGRGSGKSLLLATIAVYEAITNPYEAAPGETVAVVALAPRLKQSKDMLRYTKAHLERPCLAPLVVAKLAEEILLRNGRFIRVQAVDRSGGAARGPTYITSLFDESAFLQYEGLVVDADQWQAILAGARGVSEFRGVMSSTPNGKGGFFWETFDQNYGVATTSWQIFLGPQPLTRPDMDPTLLQEYRRADEDAFQREFMCSFDVAGTERFFNFEHVKKCICDGLREVPPKGPHVQYVCAVDPTGGSHDLMTATVVERLDDGGRVRQCLVKGWDPKDPHASTVHEIAREIAYLIAPYGINTVYGDIFGGAWVGEAFASVGLEYETRGFNAIQKVQRASLLRELFAAECIELLDEPTQIRELKEYEKKTLKSGQVTVNHPMTKDGSDDYIDSLALATWELVGHDAKLHPPETLDRWNEKKWKKDLFDGRSPDLSPETGDTAAKIMAKGEGPRWTLQNWSNDWRYCQCSLGELAWLCGVGPIQMAQVLGRDLVLQLCWARWILSYKRHDPDVILRAHFVGIYGFDEAKERIRTTGDTDGIVTYDCVGADAWRRGHLPGDWQPVAVRSRNTSIGVSIAPAFPPWTAPMEKWHLQHDVEQIYGGWPDRPWASEVERVFRATSKQRRNQREETRTHEGVRHW